MQGVGFVPYFWRDLTEWQSRSRGIHKLRRQVFENFWPSPGLPLHLQVNYINLWRNVGIWLTPPPLVCQHSLWVAPYLKVGFHPHKKNLFGGGWWVLFERFLLFMFVFMKLCRFISKNGFQFNYLLTKTACSALKMLEAGAPKGPSILISKQFSLCRGFRVRPIKVKLKCILGHSDHYIYITLKKC